MVFASRKTLAVATGLGGAKVLAVFVGAVTLVGRVILLGIAGNVITFGAKAVVNWVTGVFFGLCSFFIMGAVVEVPHSEQLLLYSISLRPHFRQNGIGSL